MATYKKGKTPDSEFEEVATRLFSPKNMKTILENNEARSFGSFKNSVKKYGERGFYEQLFERKYLGRDNTQRVSKQHRLADGIFSASLSKKQEELYPKSSYQNKHFEFEKGKKLVKRNVITVTKGNRIQFKGKLYRGGQFLPKKYFDEKESTDR